MDVPCRATRHQPATVSCSSNGRQAHLQAREAALSEAEPGAKALAEARAEARAEVLAEVEAEEALEGTRQGQDSEGLGSARALKAW